MAPRPRVRGSGSSPPPWGRSWWSKPRSRWSWSPRPSSRPWGAGFPEFVPTRAVKIVGAETAVLGYRFDGKQGDDQAMQVFVSGDGKQVKVMRPKEDAGR